MSRGFFLEVYLVSVTLFDILSKINSKELEPFGVGKVANVAEIQVRKSHRGKFAKGQRHDEEPCNFVWNSLIDHALSGC